MKREPQTIDDLRALYACDWIEDRGHLSRVTTGPEDSAWYCTLCGSLDVDSVDVICHDCSEPEICTDCDGTGEGHADGTRCWTCHGRGVLERKTEDWL